MKPTKQALSVSFYLTVLVIVLAAVASATGLFLPTVYRETAWVIPQNRGQDLVTLIALIVLTPNAIKARRGSVRSSLIWFGILGYLAYTYTGASFAYAFNYLFLVYVALFSFTGAALIAGVLAINVDRFRSAFDSGTPRRAVIVFLVTMALILSVLWLSQIVPFYTEGRLPEMIIRAQTPTVFVYVLDLGIVVPLSLLSVWWLWHDKPWGYVLASFVLVKATTMGLALLAMTGFAIRAKLNVEVQLTVFWVLLASTGLTMSIWYFRHCHGNAADSSVAGAP